MILQNDPINNTNWENTRGIVAVYKPINWTSHDVVAKIRRLSKEKRVGHGGTLDPLADGVLIVGIGREATKQLDKFSKGQKTYSTVFCLGATSETLDAEGEIIKTDNQRIPTELEIINCVDKFRGQITQIPPQHSALKVNGKPAYIQARLGNTVELKPRIVNIFKIEVTKYSYPDIFLTITCSGGTYIRAIGRDIGEYLQTGAYMKKLTRDTVGEFSLADCLHLPTNETASPSEIP